MHSDAPDSEQTEETAARLNDRVKRGPTHRRTPAGRATFRLARTAGADEALVLADVDMRLLYGDVGQFVNGRQEVELSGAPR